jgi:hypothetical protein
MTVAGWIFLIFVAAALLNLLGEGFKCAMHIDKWRDLWQIRR